MEKKVKSISTVVENIKNKEMYNIKPYQNVVEEINQLNYEGLRDEELRLISDDLRTRVKEGTPLDEILVEAFALVREVTKRVVGIRPYDVQMMAAVAIHQGMVVEMQTGEGKTLSAVMPAYLNALTGKGVHVLTFNDYLAKRDAQWMGRIYEFLGVSCGYVQEGMGLVERMEAYQMDITYLTAKEAGFDYLRDFLANEINDLVHRPFNFAIVDEADSIMIDEARIPLVIAGDVLDEGGDYDFLIDLVRRLEINIDYEIDQYQSNVILTESGIQKVENDLGCSNIYDDENLQILTKLNCALYAEVLLKKERDYIVRRGKIEIIDEFTGRVAENRQWPDAIHQAVEVKEGIFSESKGRIMGSIALQYYLKLYSKLAGMTGTAVAAKDEFNEMYHLNVVVMPTNKPCIRKDHPDMIFTHKEAKDEALIHEIKRVHDKGQPVLIGTSSVEESERLEETLRKEGIECNVLNAKNDFEEAKIIAEAGKYKAVTVSTNMAGRGIDIKLGGVEELEKDKVVAVGGLYVIGTGRHESSRIDHQLRGRAGRQGDPGESRFFVSLEDELVKKYDIDHLIPKEQYPQQQVEPLENPIINQKIHSGQRIVEGYNTEMRRQLWEYSYMVEEQRKIIHQRRLDILMDREPLPLLENKCPELYSKYEKTVGKDVLKKAEKQLTLFHLNKCWADYLEYVAYIREGIHLVVIGGEDPLHQYHVKIVDAFEKMMKSIEEEIVEIFNRVEITLEGIDLEKEGLKGPASTWTYLISDHSDQFSRLPAIVKTIDNCVKGTLFSIGSVYRGIAKRFRMIFKYNN